MQRLIAPSQKRTVQHDPRPHSRTRNFGSGLHSRLHHLELCAGIKDAGKEVEGLVMRDFRIKHAIDHAREFIRRAEIATKRTENMTRGCDAVQCVSPKTSGALRRQSLELTRALAEMRQP